MEDEPVTSLFKLPADGRARLSVGGEDGYVMLEIDDTALNVDAAHGLARALSAMDEEAEVAVLVVTVPGEARWSAGQLDGTRWSFVVILQRISEHAEREWDTPGPFEIRATALSDDHLDLEFRRIPT